MKSEFIGELDYLAEQFTSIVGLVKLNNKPQISVPSSMSLTGTGLVVDLLLDDDDDPDQNVLWKPT